MEIGTYRLQPSFHFLCGPILGICHDKLLPGDDNCLGVLAYFRWDLVALERHRLPRWTKLPLQLPFPQILESKHLLETISSVPLYHLIVYLPRKRFCIGNVSFIPSE